MLLEATGARGPGACPPRAEGQPDRGMHGDEDARREAVPITFFHPGPSGLPPGPSFPASAPSLRYGGGP